MAADVLATQVARTSAIMIIIMFIRINSVPTRWGLTKLIPNLHLCSCSIAQIRGYEVSKSHSSPRTYTCVHHYNDVISPASPLFAQLFVHAQIKENIKDPRHWLLCGEFTGDRWLVTGNAENVSIWWRYHDVTYTRVHVVRQKHVNIYLFM